MSLPAFLPLSPPFRTFSRSLPLTSPSASPRRHSLRMVASPNLNLPPPLANYVSALSTVPDPKLRYQQLLFLAQQLPPMPAVLKTESNRVHGCTSVVHVSVALRDGKVYIQGDSDAQLTKGLLALLVNGLAGATPQQVYAVDPAFIQVSGLSVSLTPSRNNGFVNMLAKIKNTVKDLEKGEIQGEEPCTVYDSIVNKLQKLQPTVLEVVDESGQHAGHAGTKGLRQGETHFRILIVAPIFESLSLVQRHRMIYTLLGEELEQGVHALSIDARSE